MKKHYYIYYLSILLFFKVSLFCGQNNSSGSWGIPTFNNSSPRMHYDSKLLDLKFKTQEFIASNIESEFIRNYFNINDSIEFNFEFTINKLGYVDSDKININTDVDFFNEKIKTIIKKLPKFTPSQTIVQGEPYYLPYSLNYSPEYYVNKQFEFVPIYREELHVMRINIHPKDNPLNDIISKSDLKNGYVNNIVYFSLNKNSSITNIRTYSDYDLISQYLVDYIQNDFKNQISNFNNLKTETNYALPVTLFFHKSIEDYENSDTVPYRLSGGNVSNNTFDVAAVFPGCEDKKGNNEITECFNKKLNSHIYKKFNSSSIGKLNTKKVQRISVFFKIDEKGNIIEVKCRTSYQSLKKEVMRVMKQLPKMSKPAMKDGEPITTSYYIPIMFNPNQKDITKNPFEINTTPFYDN